MHMHCPFCTLDSIFTDAALLKAHFRVKHIDKGIEYAGLKILRCCDSCSIFGSVKAKKELHGSHWHCYKCRNGFSRRDEALKHYSTHFRNVTRAFQIRISAIMDQNLRFDLVAKENQLKLESVKNILVSDNNCQCDDGNQLLTNNNNVADTRSADVEEVCVAANETVNTNQTDCSPVMRVTPNHGSKDIEDAESQTSKMRNSYVEKLLSDIADLSERLGQAEAEKILMEKDYKQQIGQLQRRIHQLTTDVQQLRRMNNKLHEQLQGSVDESISTLITRLKTDHERMLNRHLTDLRSEELSMTVPGIPLSTKEYSASSVIVTASGTQNMTVNSENMTVNSENMTVNSENMIVNSENMTVNNTSPSGLDCLKTVLLVNEQTSTGCGILEADSTQIALPSETFVVGVLQTDGPPLKCSKVSSHFDGTQL